MKAIRFLLFPFAVLYDFITSIRNYFYEVGIFKATTFEIPVIAVGNLSVGGTGKTPQIEYLIRLLQSDKKIAVLSRWYKRKTESFVLLDKTHEALDVGDEPLQFFQKFPDISIAVDANRVHGIQELQKRVQPEVILLDDAYQHRKVKAQFYVLLTKYNDLYTSDFILPTGNLRESRRGAERADVIVVTKCPDNLSDDAQNEIKKKLKASSSQHVFFSTIDYQNETKGTHQVSLDDLNAYEILLVTGIANPKPLLEFLKRKECKINHLNFPDHHNFTSKDAEHLTKIALADDLQLVTTEKDHVRIDENSNHQLRALKRMSRPFPIEFTFEKNDEQKLIELIKEHYPKPITPEDL